MLQNNRIIYFHQYTVVKEYKIHKDIAKVGLLSSCMLRVHFIGYAGAKHIVTLPPLMSIVMKNK